jgi:hypothetical protein
MVYLTMHNLKERVSWPILVAGALVSLLSLRPHAKRCSETTSRAAARGRTINGLAPNHAAAGEL